MKKITLSLITEQQILTNFKKGISIHSLSKEFSLGRKVIERIILSAGLELKTKSQLILDQIPLLKSKDFLYNSHFIDNKSIKDIALELKTNEQVIKTAFKKFKIKPKNSIQSKNDKLLSRYPQLLDEEYLKQKYVIERISVDALSKEIGCSDTILKRRLKELKIPLRSHEQAMSLHKNSEIQQKNAKLARNLRTRLSLAISEQSAFKYYSAVDDIGCSIEDLKKYLEERFSNGMTWDNYGEWHLDHIKPLSGFDLSNPEQQKEAIKYTNLQPMWGNLNHGKSDWEPIGELPNKVKLYIVTGLSGSGKSWVCNQLTQYASYVSFDKHYKEQHYHLMVEYSKLNKPILYDPNRKAGTYYGRYCNLFDIKLIVIDEPIDIIAQRLVARGGKFSYEKLCEMQDYIERSRKKAHFVGSSSEVFNFLNKELIKKESNDPT